VAKVGNRLLIWASTVQSSSMKTGAKRMAVIALKREKNLVFFSGLSDVIPYLLE